MYLVSDSDAKFYVFVKPIGLSPPPSLRSAIPNILRRVISITLHVRQIVDIFPINLSVFPNVGHTMLHRIAILKRYAVFLAALGLLVLALPVETSASDGSITGGCPGILDCRRGKREPYFELVGQPLRIPTFPRIFPARRSSTWRSEGSPHSTSCRPGILPRGHGTSPSFNLWKGTTSQQPWR